MSSITDRAKHPSAVYAPLYGFSATPASDPLPPVVEGPVSHYGGVDGAFGVTSGSRVFVSHAATMNDPLEGKYGWTVIHERYEQNKPTGYEPYQAVFDEILSDNASSRNWESAPFVLSGTLSSDNLNHYRLYGMYELVLDGGVWSTESQGKWADRAREHFAEWRRVLYGATQAAPYVDRMLAWAVVLMASVPEDDFEDTGLIAALALQVLALHIKPEAFSYEEEVRLVFSIPRFDWDDHVRVRSGRGRMLPYLAVRSSAHPDDFLHRVSLGPGVQGQANAEALAHLHRLCHPVSRFRPFAGDFPVIESKIQFRD